MRIYYKGKDVLCKYRLAEIEFDEQTEENLYLHIEEKMQKCGWNLQRVTEGYSLCEVDNRDEYELFKADYRKAKKEWR